MATVPRCARDPRLPDAERVPLASLRMAFAAGEPLAEPTYREWCAASLRALRRLRRLGVPGDRRQRPGDAGQARVDGPAAPGRRPARAGRALEECAPGEVGTLALRADDPALFLEYRKQPDAWREAHRGGWYITGDQAYRDEDGYLWYVGRQDDLFKSRGYLISPREIEDAILEHPAVVEAAVVGQADPEWAPHRRVRRAQPPAAAPPAIWPRRSASGSGRARAVQGAARGHRRRESAEEPGRQDPASGPALSPTDVSSEGGLHTPIRTAIWLAGRRIECSSGSIPCN